MSRTRITLAAPEGVEESIIEGTYYWPNEDGRVETTNPNHVSILQRHGYEKVGEVSIMPPATAKGPIEHDELGRTQLAAALSERGLSFPPEASRGELAEIANSWNQSRRRARVGNRAEGAPETEAGAAPRAPRAQKAKDEAKVDEAPDFSAASYEDLKGYLVAHGVAFVANTPKVRLCEMAEATYAEIVARKAAAKTAA